MSSSGAKSLAPDEALAKLMVGNERYVATRYDLDSGQVDLINQQSS